MNRRLLLLALAAVAAVSLAGGAGAGTTIQLKIGDAVDVLHTRVACYALNSNGKNGIGCVLIANGKPIPGTYSVGLAVDGTAVLNKINADGSEHARLQEAAPGVAELLERDGLPRQARPELRHPGVGRRRDRLQGVEHHLDVRRVGLSRHQGELLVRGRRRHAIPNRYGVSHLRQDGRRLQGHAVGTVQHVGV